MGRDCGNITPGEAGLSSPAVADDVVFVTTNKPALYAFDTATGVELWSAPLAGSGIYGSNVFGAALYADHVVIGSGTGQLHIYALMP